MKKFIQVLILGLSASLSNVVDAALMCSVKVLYVPSYLSNKVELDTRLGESEFLGKKLKISIPTDGLLDDWSYCLLLASHGDSDPARVSDRYRYGSLQLQCEGKNNVFVRSFLANFLPEDEGLVHGETRIVDGYSGKAIQFETSCVFRKGRG